MSSAYDALIKTTGWATPMRKLFAVAAALVLLAAAPVRADTFPSRTITLIVPFPPGGSTDVVARIMADKMSASLGQPVIVEDVGGAGGSIAVGRLARATPDGYTIDIGQWDTHVGLIIYNINFDLEKDFAPIGLMTVNPQLLIARKAFPVDSLKDLVTWLKAHPGDAKFVNQNASGQLGALLLEKLTNTQVLIIPYRGAGPAMTDLMSGTVDLAVLQAAVAMPQIQAGAIKPLADLSPTRSASLPEIPTSDEGGVPGYYLSGWFGMYAPKGTPPEIVTRLNTAMVQALAEPDVRRRFAELGIDIAAREQQTPEGLAKFQKAEIDKWWPIIKASGIRGE
jgi:tripartite-type tricarboxylate transporter receptor subunit TctC